jgi:hypothetical protein
MTDLDLIVQSAATILAGNAGVTSGDVDAAVETALMIRAVARQKLGEARAERFNAAVALDALQGAHALIVSHHASSYAAPAPGRYCRLCASKAGDEALNAVARAIQFLQGGGA